MIFLIILSALVLGIALMILDDNLLIFSGGIWATGLTMVILSSIAVFSSLLILAVNYIGVEADIEENKVRYESLIYQQKNHLYDGENNYGEKVLMKEIQSWNEDLARHKKLQRNLWVGTYYPNIYDEFEFIELNPEPPEVDTQ